MRTIGIICIVIGLMWILGAGGLGLIGGLFGGLFGLIGGLFGAAVGVAGGLFGAFFGLAAALLVILLPILFIVGLVYGIFWLVSNV